MTFALCLQVPNHIRFKRPIDIYANFIPQMIFLQSIFGYLVICILYKWTVDWSASPTQPPSLLNMLISMFLEPGHVDPATQLYRGQSVVQVVLLLMAAVCVQWLLITKPYITWKEMQKIQEQGYVGLGHGDGVPRNSSDDVLEGEEEGNGRAIAEDADEEHVRHLSVMYSFLCVTDIFMFKEHHDFGEVVIHQVIHTIEFCLGCISHTASYLRLWALSLAHAQLSEVLWSMTLESFLGPTSVFGWIGLIIMGVMWLNLTICILCIMEVRLFFHVAVVKQVQILIMVFLRGCRRSCTHSVCTGSKRTANIMKAVDMYVYVNFPHSIYRVLMMISFHVT